MQLATEEEDALQTEHDRSLSNPNISLDVIDAKNETAK